MTAPMENLLHQAKAEFDRTRRQIAELHASAGGGSTVTHSKDRSLTVTVDARGDVTAIAFKSAKFRRMPPAELGDLLVRTIAAARKGAVEQMLGVFQPVLPSGMDIGRMMAGDLDLEALFDDALRMAAEPIPGEEPGPTSGPASRRGNDG